MSLAPTDPNAAENLSGHVLATGWTVGEKIAKPPGTTGGFFSVCYRIFRGNETGFLKAFNFAKFFQLANSHGQSKAVVDVISEMIDAYKYERDLSELCRGRHVTKVAFVRDSGEHSVNGFPITIVPYLIFDTADGDVRQQITFARGLEAPWKLRSLHSVAVGLKQLHAIDVSHQDLKPSNILLFRDESKIGDLGRSTCLALPSPLQNAPFAGDWTYAPPEILYHQIEPDWRTRSFSVDSYLFGSLIVFYFSCLTMTALVRKNLPDDVSWERYRGSYGEVVPYVLQAFESALEEFAACVDPEWLRADLRTMVSYLCHPVPEQRGHPKGVRTEATRFDLERVVSRLDLLHKRSRYQVAR